jgi:hypothetical protein
MDVCRFRSFESKVECALKSVLYLSEVLYPDCEWIAHGLAVTADDDEVVGEDKTDEFSSYFDGSRPPKVMVTTCRCVILQL